MLRRLVHDRRAQRSGRSADVYSRYATVALHDAVRQPPDDRDSLDSPAQRAYRAAIAEALAGWPDLDVPFVDRNGREWSTPMRCAVHTGQWEVQGLLLDAGATLDPRDFEATLFYAHRDPDPERPLATLNAWLDAGIDPHTLVEGKTWLQPLVRHPNVLHWPESLLGRLGLDARDARGRTVLHALWDEQPVRPPMPDSDALNFARLVRAGADPYAEDHEGLAPLNLLTPWTINGLVMPAWMALLVRELPDLDLFRGNRHGNSLGQDLRQAVITGRTVSQGQAIDTVLREHERAQLERVATDILGARTEADPVTVRRRL